MMRLAWFLAAIACLCSATAHADYLGEYDHGDSISLHAVLNDNGTAADSVSGDTLKAILFFKGTPFDTIGLAQKGASLPLVAAYQKTIYADTTGRGYGPYWAVLWAVDVGAGTRDPVGVVSWTLFPRIASASGVVPRVTVTDSLTKGGFVDSVGHVAVTAHAESISGVDSAIVATLAGVTAESVWVEPIANISWQTGLAADLLRGAQRIATPARSLGEYHVGDSVTVGTKFHEVGLDSVYAYIYSGTTAMDTIKLASTAQGYYSKILVDTAGGGTEGTWQAHLLAFYSTGGNHRATSSNTWRVFNRRLYAQEVAESADVYIHDPSDAQLAGVIRDTLIAHADTFKADTVTAIVNDTMHVNVDDRPGLAAWIADSVWTGGENTRTLTEAEYGEIADSVGTNIAALDTIQYVANVGTVEVLDSGRVVARSLAVTLTDSAVALHRVREVVLPIDSVVATARNWVTDSARVLATAWHLDSARIVASCDSVGKVDTVRAVAVVTSLEQDSIGKVGVVTLVDSAVATARNWYTDSTRAAAILDRVTLADSAIGLGRMVNPLDSVVAVARAWEVDSLRVARRALAVTLADSVKGVARLRGTVDSVAGVYRVAILDSGVKVATVDSAGKVQYADTLASAFRVRYLDSAVAVGRVKRVDSTRAVALVHDLDSARTVGSVPVVDSVVNVAVCDSTGRVALVDSATEIGTVERVALVDSVAQVYRTRFLDSAKTVGRVYSHANIVSGAVEGLKAGGEPWLTVLARTDGNAADAAESLATNTISLLAKVGDAMTLEGGEKSKIADSTWYNLQLDASYPTYSPGGILWNIQEDSLASIAQLAGAGADSTRGIFDSHPLDTVRAVRAVRLVDSVRVVGAIPGITVDSVRAVGLVDSSRAVGVLDSARIVALADSVGALGPVPLVDSTARVGRTILTDSVSGVNRVEIVDSVRALGDFGAIQDSIDAALLRLGKAGGDTTVISLLRYIKSNLQAVTFPTEAISELADSIWGAKLDSSGNLRARWDSSTAAAHLWDASPKHHGQDFSVIDSSTVDTSGTRLGIFHVGGSAISGTEVYVYTLADSGWSNPVGQDLEPAADGRYYVPVYAPANGDTVLYRVRFHAPGYIDQAKIVRFPQP